MKTEDFLREVVALPGVTGNESAAAAYIAKAFEPYCDDVKIDCMNNVIGHIAGSGPKVILCAHQDEIGLMVSKIEKDGSLRMRNVGGVDPRILPGMRVTVWGKEKLMGVIGAKPPHLLTAEDRAKNYQREDLYVDLGMTPEHVNEKVQVGDFITLEYGFTQLLNNRYATKSVDDRGCVAILLRTMEALQKVEHTADLYFVATVQEEIGAYGAMTAGFGVDPEIGIVLDVCHAATPGAPALSTHELGSVVSGKGPFINRYLRKKLDEIAAEINTEVQTGVSTRGTGTDADTLTIVRGGVPTVLLELPLKYMHTSVELFDMRAVTECARLLTAYCSAIDDSWRDELWT